jgi:uncharacterized repeat protein (TIGR02543 family)
MLYPPPPPPSNIVVPAGRVWFFLSLLCIPLFFAACPGPADNPDPGGPSPSYTVTFNSNDGANQTQTVRVYDPAAGIPPADFPADPSRDGWTFTGWNTAADGSGSPFTASTAVSDDITVYAQWTEDPPEPDTPKPPVPPTPPPGPDTPPPAGITLSSPDAGSGAFNGGNFTLSQGGSDSKTITINGDGYTDPRWYVDGALKGTAGSITINAGDYGVGVHSLSLIINKDGGIWSKDITFTVTN